MTGKDAIKQFIIEEILQKDSVQDITDDLDLISLNILDSLSILKLITYLEQKNNITIEIDELDFDEFKSLNTIYKLVMTKTRAAE